MDLPNRAPGTPPPTDEVIPAAVPPLDGDEELQTVLRGIGSVMFLTTARIIVARDGHERRPRSGIQTFPLDTIRHLRIERGNGPSGRVVVSSASGQELISMFFEPRSLDKAQELIAKGRLQVARRRRVAPKASERPRDPEGQS